jgi:two-component system chemotaxis response regulator CheB
MSHGLSDEETEVLYKLIEELTGTHQSGLDRKDFLKSSVMDLMREARIARFPDFLECLSSSTPLYQKFLSAITIHTTSWFREKEHFQILHSWVLNRIRFGERRLDIVSLACSSGQEVYSLGLLLESVRRLHPSFDYSLRGLDIDPVSLATARRAVYPLAELSQIPAEYHPLCLTQGEAKKGWLTIDEEILRRCAFEEANLLDWTETSPENSVDVVFCRNVLIYFHPRRVARVIDSLSTRLKPEGLLFLSQREGSGGSPRRLQSWEPSVYRRKLTNPPKLLALVIDDVAPVRTLLVSALSRVGFDVLEASSAEEASAVLAQQSVDFITLDLELPEENGASWLRRLRLAGCHTPVVIVSGSSPEEAKEVYGLIEDGASEYFLKENLSSNLGRLGELADALVRMEGPSHASSSGRFSAPKGPGEALRRLGRPELILIGASTGGPPVIWDLIGRPSRSCPPIVVVQHTSASFLKPFAEKCSERSGLPLGPPRGPLQPGHLYIAQEDHHLVVRRDSQGRLEIGPSDGGPRHGHRPSVDCLFESAATAGARSAAFLLTGMGQDGAAGMKALLEKTISVNFAQSRDSCAIFGMPQEAIRLGAVHEVGDPAVLKQRLESFFHEG